MQRKLLEILVCPACKGELGCRAEHTENDAVIEGSLDCPACAKSYNITSGIPRFVE